MNLFRDLDSFWHKYNTINDIVYYKGKINITILIEIAKLL